jgi:hypothetical protein
MQKKITGFGRNLTIYNGAAELIKNGGGAIATFSLPDPRWTPVNTWLWVKEPFRDMAASGIFYTEKPSLDYFRSHEWIGAPRMCRIHSRAVARILDVVPWALDDFRNKEFQEKFAALTGLNVVDFIAFSKRMEKTGGYLYHLEVIGELDGVGFAQQWGEEHAEKLASEAPAVRTKPKRKKAVKVTPEMYEKMLAAYKAKQEREAACG